MGVGVRIRCDCIYLQKKSMEWVVYCCGIVERDKETIRVNVAIIFFFDKGYLPECDYVP